MFHYHTTACLESKRYKNYSSVNAIPLPIALHRKRNYINTSLELRRLIVALFWKSYIKLRQFLAILLTCSLKFIITDTTNNSDWITRTIENLSVGIICSLDQLSWFRWGTICLLATDLVHYSLKVHEVSISFHSLMTEGYIIVSASL